MLRVQRLRSRDVEAVTPMPYQESSAHEGDPSRWQRFSRSPRKKRLCRERQLTKRMFQVLYVVAGSEIVSCFRLRSSWHPLFLMPQQRTWGLDGTGLQDSGLRSVWKWCKRRRQWEALSPCCLHRPGLARVESECRCCLLLGGK